MLIKIFSSLEFHFFPLATVTWILQRQQCNRSRAVDWRNTLCVLNLALLIKLQSAFLSLKVSLDSCHPD